MKRYIWDRGSVVAGRDKKICCICGREIIGEYDFNITKRKTKMYFHKRMKCLDKK